MTVTSKFRKLYLAKYVFLFIVILILIISSCFFTYDTKDGQTFLLISLFTLSFTIPISMDLFKLSRISISKEGITNVMVFSNKRKFIKFEDIENFGHIDIQPQIKKSKTFFRFTPTLLILKNGDTLVISPDYYENYLELNKAIMTYYQKE